MVDNKPSENYKSSDYTSVKQASLYNLFTLHMPVVRAVRFNARSSKPYLYVDLHGGKGRDDDGNPGSPIVFAIAALENGIDHVAHIYERDKKTYKLLVKNCAHIPFMHLHNEDHQGLINPMKNIRDYNRFGLVYSDPSNADPAFDLLRQFNQSYPRLDIAINIAAASYKRMRNIDTWVRLNKELETIKKYWIVRRPMDKFQWSILFGTNWDKHPDWPSRDFFHFNSQVGKEWFLKMVYTKKEILRTKQKPLLLDKFKWDSYEDYLSSPVFKSIRSLVMMRANDMCQMCKRRSATEVHHVKYSQWYNGQPDNVNNMIAVCHRCHCVIHNKAS